MKPEIWGMILGGLLPAIIFGVSGVLQKTAVNAGVATGPYLISLGLGVIVTGLIFAWTMPGDFSVTGLAWSGLVGLVWAIGTGCIALALHKFGTPIAKLVPLYNMNTLVAVLLGLVFFAEAASLNLWKLLAGAILIALGGILVAGA